MNPGTCGKDFRNSSVAASISGCVEEVGGLPSCFIFSCWWSANMLFSSSIYFSSFPFGFERSYFGITEVPGISGADCDEGVRRSLNFSAQPLQDRTKHKLMANAMTIQVHPNAGFFR